MKPLSKILYLEDDPHISEIAMIALRDIAGFEVLHCGQGQDAIDRYAAFQPDMLLLDVMLPDLDGPQVLEAIRKLEGGADVPAIFMTAKAQKHEQDAYMQQGAISVIVKPFDALTLGETLESLWKSRAHSKDETAIA